MSKFKVIATIEQIIEADTREKALSRANQLIDVNGVVSFNTGKIKYQIENYRPEFIWRCVPNVNYYLEIEADDEDEALMKFESLIGDYQSDLYYQLFDLGFMELSCNWNFAEEYEGFFCCYPCIDLSIDIKANTEEEALKKMGDLIKPFMDSFQKKLVDLDFKKTDYPVGFCTDSWKEGEE